MKITDTMKQYVYMKYVLYFNLMRKINFTFCMKKAT